MAQQAARGQVKRSATALLRAAAAGLLLCVMALLPHSARACLPEGGVNTGVTQGKATHVCVVASPLVWTEGTNTFSRVAFLPTTDRFSRLTFAESA
jgi:hypothetical protein